jgi:sugar (pentulose or hexulose) kinase
MKKRALGVWDLGASGGRCFAATLADGALQLEETLCQWIADAAMLPVRTGHYDATAAGNAMVQAVSHGWIHSLSEGRELIARGTKERRHEPNPLQDWAASVARMKEFVGGNVRHGRLPGERDGHPE